MGQGARADGPNVVVGVADEERRRQVVSCLTGLRGRASLDVRPVSEVADEPAPAVVLLGAGHRAAEVRALRKHLPTSAFVLCLAWSDPALRHLAAIARAGADDVIMVDESDSERELIRVVSQHVRYHVEPSRWPQEILGQSTFASCVSGWIIRHAHRRLTASRVADWFRLDEGTVNRRLKRAGSATVGRQIAAARMLHVLAEFDRTGDTGRVVAERLEFESAEALRMFLYRRGKVGRGVERERAMIERKSSTSDAPQRVRWRVNAE